MRIRIAASLAALALGASLMAIVPASAQVGRGASSMAEHARVAGPAIQEVQYRRRWHGPRPHRRGNAGAAVAAGIIGLAAGAIIAGSAAAAPPPAYYAPRGDQAWIDYCFSKYRSFDPATGTYLGYDGYRHPCR